LEDKILTALNLVLKNTLMLMNKTELMLSLFYPIQIRNEI